MSTPISVSGTAPDGTKHIITLSQTGADTATIDDEAWAPNSSQPHRQVYEITDVRHSGDVVSADLRIFLFNAKITFTLFDDRVQLIAPGHNMTYPVTSDEHAEAETFMAGFPAG